MVCVNCANLITAMFRIIHEKAKEISLLFPNSL